MRVAKPPEHLGISYCSCRLGSLDRKPTERGHLLLQDLWARQVLGVSNSRDCGRSGEKGDNGNAGRSWHGPAVRWHVPPGAPGWPRAFGYPSVRTMKSGSGAAASLVLLSTFLTLCLFLFHLFSLFFQKRKSSSSVQLMVSVLRLPQCRYCWASPHVPAFPRFWKLPRGREEGPPGLEGTSSKPYHPQSPFTGLVQALAGHLALAGGKPALVLADGFSCRFSQFS